MRFGLDGGEPLLLQDIDNRLKMTKERVRQIERRALAKLNEWLAA
jgi:DNA-directed RNA polymerase sigma subunit (sigma70/sigma32)